MSSAIPASARYCIESHRPGDGIRRRLIKNNVPASITRIGQAGKQQYSNQQADRIRGKQLLPKCRGFVRNRSRPRERGSPIFTGKRQSEAEWRHRMSVFSAEKTRQSLVRERVTFAPVRWIEKVSGTADFTDGCLPIGEICGSQFRSRVTGVPHEQWLFSFRSVIWLPGSESPNEWKAGAFDLKLPAGR